MKPRVAVALSGGVDSSVAAYLLKQQGHELIGVSMRLYDASDSTGNSGCCSPEDFLDARAVAGILDIPYYVLNLEREFQRLVIDRFVADYNQGLTPSPCVLCNTHLKFRHLLSRMRAAGAELVATGHYAGREGTGPYRLVRARDLNKDQSYFLFEIAQQELARTVFPLAELCKEQVREIASRAGLPTASKSESQEICFVEDGDYAGFVAARSPQLRSGPIVDGSGQELGRHQGIHRYTVGQRRGLGVSAAEKLYVTRVDAAANTVVVGPLQELDCLEFETIGSSWIGEAPVGEFQTQVKARYTRDPSPCTATVLADQRVRVKLDAPLRGVSPGQAAVFYDGDTVLGGGWIRRPCPD